MSFVFNFLPFYYFPSIHVSMDCANKYSCHFVDSAKVNKIAKCSMRTKPAATLSVRCH